jgi:hypothetical protein
MLSDEDSTPLPKQAARDQEYKSNLVLKVSQIRDLELSTRTADSTNAKRREALERIRNEKRQQSCKLVTATVSYFSFVSSFVTLSLIC